MYQGISNLAMSLMNVPPDSFTGNAEYSCCLLLFKTLQIDKVQYYQLFGQQRNDLLLFVRAALWCKAPC